MTTGESLHTDGNAIAGLLEELLAMEMTTAMRACQSCRAQNPVGAHRLYRGAGLVLRCPACEDLALCITPLARGHAVTLFGTWVVAPAA